MREFFHNGEEIGYVIYTIALDEIDPWFYDGHGNWARHIDYAKVYVVQVDAMMVRNAMSRMMKARIGRLSE